MKEKKVQITQLKQNERNPRYIKDDKYQKLVNSLRTFPEMLEVRKIVCNSDLVVLGGNMRLLAAKDAGITDLTVNIVDWPEEKQNEFIIKDNLAFGEWDWDILANQWEVSDLNDWGLDIPNFVVEDVDYSVLDDENVDKELEAMSDGVKKAIMIEFDLSDYDEAFELVKFFREQGMYLGGWMLNEMRKTKEKM
jgi:ParB-like chromosome segregation protein Spo0J